MNPRRPAWPQWVEAALLTIGICCIGWYAVESARVAWFQRDQTAALERAVDARVAVAASNGRPTRLPDDTADRGTDAKQLSSVGTDTTGAVPATARHDGPAGNSDPNLIGRIQIPRIRVSGVIRTGEDAETLRSAVGHLPGTARPGELGNVALAAHRDSFFKGLRDVRPGDGVRILTPIGEFTYRVTKTLVVDPEDVWVLDAAVGRTLTLITCYPFNYVGSAPRRFIVRAEQVSAPEEPPVTVTTTRFAFSDPRDIELLAPAPQTARLTPEATTTPRAAGRGGLRSSVARTRRGGRTSTVTARTASPSGNVAKAATKEGTKAAAFKRGMGKLFSPFKRIFRKGPPKPPAASATARNSVK